MGGPFIGLKCEKCGAGLDYSYKDTVEAYDSDEENLEILPVYTIYDYLVYTCMSCGFPVRFTYKQVEEKERLAIAEMRKQIKMNQAAKTFNFSRENSRYLSEIDKYKKIDEERRFKAILKHIEKINGL